MGKTFVSSSNKVGMASYHFSLSGSYVSYESAPEGCRLDNGSEIPKSKKMYFDEIQYNLDKGIFKANVYVPLSFED